MGKLDKHLKPSEKIFLEGGAHTVVHLPAILSFILTMIFVIPFSMRYNADDPTSGGLFLLFSVIFFILMLFLVVYGLLMRGAITYAVTNRRILMKSAIFQRELVDIPLQDVESIHMQQGGLGRLFNFGTLVVVRKEGQQESVPMLSRLEKLLETSNQIMDKFAQAYEKAVQNAGK